MRLLSITKRAQGFRQRIDTALAVLESPAGFWLYARMAAWALVLRPLKFVVPVRWLARLMWVAAETGARARTREARVITLAGLLYRRRAEGYCLERSLLLYRFLSSKRADPHLILGLLKTAEGWKGHAWIVVDGEPVGESADGLHDFTPLFMFGPNGAMQAL